MHWLSKEAIVTLSCCLSDIAASNLGPVCLIVRFCKVSKPEYSYLEWYDRSEIYQAPQQQCCWWACQISKRWDDMNHQSHSLEISQDLYDKASDKILKQDPVLQVVAHDLENNSHKHDASILKSTSSTINDLSLFWYPMCQQPTSPPTPLWPQILPQPSSTSWSSGMNWCAFQKQAQGLFITSVFNCVATNPNINQSLMISL